MKSLLPVEFLPRRRWPIWGVLAMLGAMAWLGWQAWRTAEASRLLSREREGVAALVRSARGSTPPMTASERQRHAQIDAVARYLATPWAIWLAVLEEHAAGPTLVRRLEQDAQTATLKVTSRTMDTAAMMTYLTALQADRRLAEVRLINYEVLRSEPGAPVQFEWTAGPGQGAPNDQPKTAPATASSLAGRLP